METTHVPSSPSFKRLMVATDFSARSSAAFHSALNLCRATGACLLLLHVFERTKDKSAATGTLLSNTESLFSEARRSLDDIAKEALEAGVDCKPMICAGIAPAIILDTIRAEAIDLVVLGTNAPHGFERLTCGSTVDAVLRNATCPVLTIGTQVEEHIVPMGGSGPVVFATDFNEATTQAIGYACSCCEIGRSSLHCVHVLPRMLDGASRDPLIPRIVSEALLQIVRGVAATDVPVISAVMYGSEVSNAVVEYARAKGASLIVLGTRQAPPLQAHMPPHIADRIVADAPCPVLTKSFALKSRLVFAGGSV